MKPLIRVEELTPDVVLLDARSAASYAAGHLEGARNADVDVHLSERGDPAHGGRHPLPPLDRWLRQLGAWGIAPSTRVVVYDDQLGANAAARAWWMLRSVGHEDVAVLDGRWQDLPLTSAAPQVDPLPPYPAERWLLANRRHRHGRRAAPRSGVEGARCAQRSPVSRRDRADRSGRGTHPRCGESPLLRKPRR